MFSIIKRLFFYKGPEIYMLNYIKKKLNFISKIEILTNSISDNNNTHVKILH